MSTDPQHDPAAPPAVPPAEKPEPGGDPAETPAVVSVPEVSSAAPPVVQVAPVKPGPGLPMALVWAVAFFALQIVVIIGLVVFLMLVNLLLHGMRGMALTREQVDRPIVLVAFGTIGVFLSALAITVLALRGQFRRALALRLPTLTHTLLAVFLVLPLYLLVIQVALAVMPWLPKLGMLENLEQAIREAPYGLVFVIGALMPGISEELLCRGFLGRGLVARWGPILGIVWASLLFGAIHIEPVQICYAAFLGAVLHLVYLSTKSLLVPMLMHTLNNAIAFAPGALAETWPQLDAMTTQWEQEGSLPLLLLLPALAATALLLLLIWQTRVRWYRCDGRAWDPGYATAEMPPAVVGGRAVSARPHLGLVLAAIAVYALFLAALAYQIGWGVRA
jgi:membrane protease YdiL (CAAX protease family)